MASFVCPSCGHTQNAPDAYIGRKTKCLQCKTIGEIVAGEPMRKPPVSQARAAMANPETDAAADRYPNLNKYLNWSATLMQIVLVAGWIVVGLMGGVRVLSLITSEKSGMDLTIELGAAILIPALMALVIYVIYVATMASIEIVRVLIDIEANTRTR